MPLVDGLRSASRVTLLLAVVGLAAACDTAKRDGSGAIVDGGDLDVFTMQIGDCFQGNEPGEVEAVTAVRCTELHDNEVYYIFALRDGGWPGQENVEKTAFEGCLPAFENYVGTAYEASRLDYTWMTPTQRSWSDKDDREIVCVLYDANLDQLMGSMQNSRE